MPDLADIRAALAAPVIVAPMFLVSSPALALAACREGLIGSLPAHSARTPKQLQSWLIEMREGLAQARSVTTGPAVAAYAVNLVMHSTNDRASEDLELIIEHRVPIVITSKGAPGHVVQRIHEYGGLVLSDIANQRHAQKAASAGVDGLIAVCAGAGGHTGTLNPFAFMNEIREDFDGPIVLAGGITTGRDVAAAELMGASFAYIGTRFIPTLESLAEEGHKRMIVASRASDVFFTAAVDGAPANFLAASLVSVGMSLEELAVTRPGKIVAVKDHKRWKDIWSAGHGVGTIHEVQPAAEVCRQIVAQYNTYRAAR